MALADFDALRDLQANPNQTIFGYRANPGFVQAPILKSSWKATGSLPSVGATPSTAVVPTSATAGAIPFVNAGSGRQILVGGSINTLAQGGDRGTGGRTLLLIDRLSQQGGLVANVTTPQTTNLPTAALTRYTSGVGVWIALESYTAFSAAATTYIASYTNQAGVAAHTAGALSSDFGDIGAFVVLALQSGDTGAKSVESLTVGSAAGTAGNLGIVLFRPLALIAMNGQQSHFDILDTVGWNEEIQDDACLQLLGVGDFESSGDDILYTLNINEC